MRVFPADILVVAVPVYLEYLLTTIDERSSLSIGETSLSQAKKTQLVFHGIRMGCSYIVTAVISQSHRHRSQTHSWLHQDAQIEVVGAIILDTHFQSRVLGLECTRNCRNY